MCRGKKLLLYDHSLLSIHCYICYTRYLFIYIYILLLYIKLNNIFILTRNKNGEAFRRFQGLQEPADPREEIHPTSESVR